MKQPQGKAPTGRTTGAKTPRPARLPKAPKAPTTELSEAAKRALADDDQERRDAAKAYLDSERAASGSGLEVPDLPQQKPHQRDRGER